MKRDFHKVFDEAILFLEFCSDELNNDNLSFNERVLENLDSFLINDDVKEIVRCVIK